MSAVSHIRPGFVYAAARAADPDWVKVGYTRRAPTRRVAELANAGHREEFVLLDCRFVWDASQAERRVHEALAQDCPRAKEFFQLPAASVSCYLDAMERLDAGRQPAHRSRRWATADDLPVDWWEDQCAQWRVLAQKGGALGDQAVRSWERASAGGFGLASASLAEYVMTSGAAPDQWAAAQWLFSAAIKQGAPAASTRKALWNSRVDIQAQEAWWDMCSQAHDILLADGALAEHVRDALLEEQASWSTHPERAQAWAAHHASRRHASASAPGAGCRI